MDVLVRTAARLALVGVAGFAILALLVMSEVCWLYVLN